MVSLGIDYSSTRPDPACLVSKGITFAGRYLEPASDWKTLRLPEVESLHAVGITIFSLFETSEGRSLAGFNAGATDAAGVIARMPEVKMPANRPVYFAVDFDATLTQLKGPITQYFKGIATKMSLSLIGAYGGYYTIKYLFDNKLITWGFQAAAWSKDPVTKQIMWDKRAHIQQYTFNEDMCGAVDDIDRCRGMFEDIGQWPKPLPGGKPVLLYRVVSGDSYWKICEKVYADGKATSERVADLQAANNNQPLHPDDLINIPGRVA